DKYSIIEFETTADGALRIFARSGTANRVRIYDVSDLLSDEYWGSKSDPAQRHLIDEARLASLASFVSLHLDGAGGIGAGGGAITPPSSVEGVAGKLIVSDTPLNQREVETLLGWLRRMR
ncbi:MAG TPA: hypothetical protein VFE47_05875, partial [Tepidisphaeraceae bacterium]|nr:hypothetical protein [Tepidisphaeraceae bacterium]